MTLDELFKDNTVKSKARAKAICEWLMKGELPVDELLVYTEKLSHISKATCIEAIECATRKSSALATEQLLNYLTNALKADEPRIKWESAKVTGNIAGKFPELLKEPTEKLLNNSNHEGTVVRWATAYALGEITKLKTDLNKELLPKIDQLCEMETDNGVKNKYLEALKKLRK